MSEVHRYKVVKMLSEAGNQISYDPHGPDVVVASAYDQLKAELAGLRTGFDAQNQVIAELRKGPAFDREAARLAIRKAMPDYPGDGLDYALFAAIDAAMGKGDNDGA